MLIKKIHFQRKYLILILLFLTILAIPLTVYNQQQQQQTQSDASTDTSSALNTEELCTLKPNTIQGEVFEAVLTGDQVVPPTDSPALGRARVVIPASNSVVDLVYASYCYTGMTDITFLIQIHYPAAAGKEADDEELLATANSPHGSVYDFPFIVDKEALEYLREGLWYISIESTGYDFEQEIRGQFSNGSTTQPTPTKVATPTATPIPQATSFDLTIFVHGIGNSGDNANPTGHSLSNKNPVHTKRDVTIKIHDETDTLVEEKSGTLTYSRTSGNFQGTLSLENQLPSRNYIIRIESPTYLTRRVAGFITVQEGKTNSLPPITLIAGDANKDNALNILDYNTIIGCYTDFAPPSSCTPEKKPATDLTDDEAVNQFDYNLFLRNLSVQKGD